MEGRVRLERRYVVAAALVVALLAVAGAAAWLWPRPDPGVLEANGQVRGTEVTVSAKAGGIVEVVAVREGAQVAKGDLIAQIGAADIEARHAQAEATAEAAEAQLAQIDTAIEQARLGTAVTRGTLAHGVHQAGEALKRAEAEVLVAQAQQRQDRAALERFEKLFREGFVSESYMDEVRARSRTSAARLEAALRAREEARAAVQRSRAASGEADVRERDEKRLRAERAALRAQLEAARARTREIEVALRDARLVAPSAGTVVNRLAEPGELLGEGLSTRRLQGPTGSSRCDRSRVHRDEHRAGERMQAATKDAK